MAQHTLSVLVENSPGVLARVASLFSRRGYNIDSLAVGPTESPEISRITIVLNLEGHALDQVSAQLFKLVNVIGIQEMEDKNSHQRELLMVKVSSAGDNRSKIEAVLGKYRAAIVSQASSSLTIER
jgi:acetolactate synthase, small subunit